MGAPAAMAARQMDSRIDKIVLHVDGIKWARMALHRRWPDHSVPQIDVASLRLAR